MPTTLAGLLVFIVTLLPGFVFIAIYTWDRPRRRSSTLEQTAAIVLGSILAQSVTSGAYVVVTRRYPKIAAPSLDLLIQKPDEHLGWIAGLLAISSALAMLAAYLMRRRKVHPTVMSSWWTLFYLWRNRQSYSSIHIQCELDDGSCVTGVLGDWNTIEEDSADRDLILGSPITYRPAGSHEYHSHPVSVAWIPARHIVAMFVTYSDATSTPSAEAGAGAEAEAEEALQARSPAADLAHARDPADVSSGQHQTQVSAPGYRRPPQSPSASTAPAVLDGSQGRMPSAIVARYANQPDTGPPGT